MLTKIKTAALVGVKGFDVTVETDIHSGMPGFSIVGLADTTIRESFSRIKPAIMNSGYSFPNRRVTVNLAPAGVPKEGSHFDLPIALGIIGGQMEMGEDMDTAYFGELSLDGRINHIRGALPLAMSARASGIKRIVIPESNAAEVSIMEDMEILPAADLVQAVDFASGRTMIKPASVKPVKKRRKYREDFSQVLGQESVKRAILVGTAGRHGILMIGGPGCGKTMMAKRIPTILPELTYEEKLEITGIYSVAGMLSEEVPIIETRPFRSPHHTVSSVGLTGGGRRPRPGELSLAHRGVLFLDELGEFDSRALDSMRQPVEEGFVRINRNLQEVVFPSDVMLVAAANPCKCGNLWDDTKVCTCTQRQLDAHRRKLTGPFSDRIDMHIRVSPVRKENITGKNEKAGLSSDEMRRMLSQAVDVQRERYRDMEISYNGELTDEQVRRFCTADRECSDFLNDAYEKFGLTMRAFNGVLKVARTIADIDGADDIKLSHGAEAMAYRICRWE